MTATPRTRSHALVGVQLLRGIAASLVVVSHADTMMGKAEFFGHSPYPFQASGAFGVALFFVISGFVIAYVTLDPSGKPRLTIRDYAGRRFVRIVPFMWLCALAYNLLSFAATRQVEWLPMLRGLFLWPVGELKPNVLWSLRHEWIFYLLFAIALMGRRRHFWVLGAWFVAPIVYGGMLALWGDAVRPANPVVADLLRVVLLGSDYGANLQFAAGFALGVARVGGARWVAERRLGLWPVLAVAVAGAAIVEALRLPTGMERMLVWTAIVAPIAWLGIISDRRTGPLARIGTMLGDASFAIYLVHNPVLLILFHIGLRHGGAIPLTLLHPLFVLIAIAAGVVVHYALEVPLLAWLAGAIRVAPWQRRAAISPISGE